MQRNNQVAVLNKIIHERARLLILTYLATNEKNEMISPQGEKALYSYIQEMEGIIKTLKRN